MRIIIYTRNDCVQCHATRRAMESRGLAFEMVNVDQQPDAALERLPPGYDQSPAPLLYGGQRMSLIVYFSSRSENTHRFVQRLGLPAVRIPLNEREHLRVDEPYILIVPSYGGGGTAGAVPRQAIRFLNDVHNRQLIRGVIAAGNRNFGDGWGRAGDVIAQKCAVPYLYRFELMGTPDDINTVRKGVSEFWQRQPQNV